MTLVGISLKLHIPQLTKQAVELQQLMRRAKKRARADAAILRVPSLDLASTPANPASEDMLALMLENPSNHCVANASTIAWLWAGLQTKLPMMHIWGERAPAIFEWLPTLGSASSYNLTTLPWFRDVLNSWGPLGRQADVPEFVQMLIGSDSAAFRLGWQRRVEKGDSVDIEDSREHFHPLVLQLPPVPQPKRLNVMQLLSMWQQVDGMCAALSLPPGILCVQVTRAYQNEANQVIKSSMQIQAYPIL